MRGSHCKTRWRLHHDLGRMAADGVGEMVLCEGLMYTEKYTEVPDTALLPSYTQIFGDTNMGGFKYQQDNAACHKSCAMHGLDGSKWCRALRLATTVSRSKFNRVYLVYFKEKDPEALY
jgi:hypothetical protein